MNILEVCGILFLLEVGFIAVSVFANWLYERENEKHRKYEDV